MLLVQLIQLVGCHLARFRGIGTLARGNFSGKVKDWSPGKNKPGELAENVKKSEGPRVNKKGDEGGGLLDKFAFMQRSSFPMQSVRTCQKVLPIISTRMYMKRVTCIGFYI